jgi:hypothetical protein
MADASDFRRSASMLLIAAATAIAAAKVVGAENVLEPSRYTPPTPNAYSASPPDPPRNWPSTRPDPSPMFGSNDKSRWATVRALVDHGTYVIGTRHYPDGSDAKRYRDEGIVADPQYKSLDIILRPLAATDAGKSVSKEFYSTKPPLYSTLLAGEYWLLKKIFGWSIVPDRWLVIPTILLTVNVFPFAIYLVMLSRLIEGTGKTDYAKLLAFTAACFGTFLTTFSGALNNHMPAAFCTLFAVYPVVKSMAESREMSPREYARCGFFAAFAATFDLPALALLAALGLPLVLAHPRRTLFCFVPAALLPIAGYFITNYAALGELSPAYEKFGGAWYNFDGSHWSKRGTALGKGIDFNDEPTSVYAFHLLAGHHGWFSLTPVFLLALGGLIGLGIRSAADVKNLFGGAKGTAFTPPLFAAISLAISLAVFLFYLTRTASYNYGGFTSGPRWLFWLIPLWLLAIPPAADRLATTRAGRALGALLLGLSVFSAFYPAWNPWRSPWIQQLLEFTGFLKY